MTQMPCHSRRGFVFISAPDDYSDSKPRVLDSSVASVAAGKSPDSQLDAATRRGRLSSFRERCCSSGRAIHARNCHRTCSGQDSSDDHDQCEHSLAASGTHRTGPVVASTSGHTWLHRLHNALNAERTSSEEMHPGSAEAASPEASLDSLLDILVDTRGPLSVVGSPSLAFRTVLCGISIWHRMASGVDTRARGFPGQVWAVTRETARGDGRFSDPRGADREDRR
jgi:hypothetical protein